MQADNSSLEKLLAAAARSLGTRPQDLQKAAQNGSLDQMLQQANPQDAEKLRRVLTDQKAAEKLLNETDFTIGEIGERGSPLQVNTPFSAHQNI